MRSLKPARALAFPVPSRDDLFGPLEHQFDRFFTEFFNHDIRDTVKSSSGYPRIDVLTEGEWWMVKAALPGVDRKNLRVEVLPSNGYYEDSTVPVPATLRISGEMKQEYRSNDEQSRYLVRELHKSKFSRTIQLPDYIVGEPDAELRDGILTLRWKHQIKQSAPQTKVISIRDGDAKTGPAESKPKGYNGEKAAEDIFPDDQ